MLSKVSTLQQMLSQENVSTKTVADKKSYLEAVSTLEKSESQANKIEQLSIALEKHVENLNLYSHTSEKIFEKFGAVSKNLDLEKITSMLEQLKESSSYTMKLESNISEFVRVSESQDNSAENQAKIDVFSEQLESVCAQLTLNLAKLESNTAQLISIRSQKQASITLNTNDLEALELELGIKIE